MVIRQAKPRGGAREKTRKPQKCARSALKVESAPSHAHAPPIRVAFFVGGPALYELVVGRPDGQKIFSIFFKKVLDIFSGVW